MTEPTLDTRRFTITSAQYRYLYALVVKARASGYAGDLPKRLGDLSMRQASAYLTQLEQAEFDGWKT